MPIYDYVCGACGTTTEVVHGIHDVGPLFCPACGKKGRMKKALTVPTIVFKGSGWAKKDRSSISTSSRASRQASSEKTADNKEAGGPTETSTSTPGEAAPSSKATDG
ncbi:MAG TPA: FmdB family zinc ribbon protein [Candidatus Limnocylindrales bacterium]|nr:FmdB family zinc ribbon protein [Candidatus Limnocylindrales bacterium]